MKTMEILFVRVYITEGSHLLEKLLTYLKNEAKISGASVFRAIHGFGISKMQHSAALVDLSLDLPVVLEFFDEEKKIKPILKSLQSTFKLKHMVFWKAKTAIIV